MSKTTLRDLIEGNKKIPLALGVLRGMSHLYACGVKLRNMGYETGLFKTVRVDAKVVSVGNIVCGGSGKTALIDLLGHQVVSGKRVAILSRGYRSEWEKEKESKKITKAELPPVEFCGDEPYLLAAHLPQADVWVGRDRVQSARRAVQEGAQVLLLDDGMQHRRLHRDLELVVIDAQDPFGRGHFLPRGWLRDDPKRLRNADYLFFNHIQNEEQFESLKKEFQSKTDAAMIGMRYRSQKRLDQKKVGVFCALGRPQRFRETVEFLGGQVVQTAFAPDHMSFSLEELENFAKTSKELGADCLVCTEKDAVKLPYSLSLPLPIQVIKGKLEIAYGAIHWEHLISRIIA